MAAPTPPFPRLTFPAVDTVLRFACLSADEVRLVVFDHEGGRRIEATCLRTDADDVSLALLRTVRALYAPRRPQLL